ncbi:type VI secretion system accessory protein TagJ [Actibacterium ureilyticum]|uniref:type VI secretion system accessory protein TagJ n=1 Tax=Actibacterium ureilyticum TaxID=1590614 RepID=UPI000BAB2254|nr:type VI secretion system accessory protein TagJ [Actibacterium ureilyticum]
MQAEDLIRSGDLDGALAALQDAVRGDASNPKLRVFLFQLLCVRGDWQRAVQQLKISAEMDPSATAMAQTYREAIICEVFREKVFAGEREPLIFGAPQEWVALMVEALKLQADGATAAANATREKAFAAVPDAPGQVNGEPFAWIADADMRLGPLLEVIVNGRYFWMPFSAIRTATFDPPADLRDAVWTPANLTLANGGDVVALIPTRYPGTVAHGSDSDRLARSTNWIDRGDDLFEGLGQRILTTDREELALMDLRTLQMGSADG